MRVTRLKGIYIDDKYGSSKQIPPAPWVLVEFNFRLKKHRLAYDSVHTRIVQRVTGFNKNGKYFTPTFEYYTDTPEAVELIKKNGELTNAALFILEE